MQADGRFRYTHWRFDAFPAHASELEPLLEPGHRIETCLVAVKMLGRMFESQPPSQTDQYPALAEKVNRIADALLNPYAVCSPESAALAQLSIFALAAMGSTQALRELAALRHHWSESGTATGPSFLLSQLLQQAVAKQAADGERRKQCLPRVFTEEQGIYGVLTSWVPVRRTVRVFVKHTALCFSDISQVACDQEIEVAHMGRPLENPGKLNVHAEGHVPLTNDEVSQVETRIEKIRDEYVEKGAARRQQYIIHSPRRIGETSTPEFVDIAVSVVLVSCSRVSRGRH